MYEEMTAYLANHIVNEILKNPGKKISADEKIISSGIIDSFSLVDLALFIEDTYGVIVDDAELNAETFDTLNELVNLIQSRL
ncbi:MAG: acyl carrier protein [Anaerolineaceae bacterium]|nr:acyl carrier protein [Anaerolineaceae bacterium]